MIGFGLLYMVCFAVLFYRIAEMDGKTGIIWAGLSIAVYFLTARFIDRGFVGILGMQFLLFIAMWILNAVKK